jgi:hypothetical protein
MGSCNSNRFPLRILLKETGGRGPVGHRTNKVVSHLEKQKNRG